MTQAFYFSEYQYDFIANYLRDHPDLPDNQKQSLADYASLLQSNDNDLENYLGQTTYVPSLGLARIASQTLATSNFGIITWDTQSWASTSAIVWAASPNGTRATVQETGIIAVGCSLKFDIGTGDRELIVYANGGIVEITGATGAGQGGTINDRLSASGQYYATAGDYIEAYVLQVSGGDLGVTARMQLSYLGKAA